MYLASSFVTLKLKDLEVKVLLFDLEMVGSWDIDQEGEMWLESKLNFEVSCLFRYLLLLLLLLELNSILETLDYGDLAQ